MFQWNKDNRDLIVLYARLAALAAFAALAALLIGFLASQLSNIWRWTVGLAFAVIIGHITCRRFLRALRDDYMRLPNPHNILGRSRGVPSSLVGVFESLVFSVTVGVFYKEPQALAGIFAVMALWLGAKMLAGWNRDVSTIIKDRPEREREQFIEERSRGAFSALLAGALNLAIAGVGGNIAAGGTVVSGGVTFFREVAGWILRFLATLPP